jgi:demethylmenaquinone methyltransferase/2-methoxy-6-polyprenyl-1,4-benzoquinol methylase
MPAHPTSRPYAIEPARAEDLAKLARIERAANALFADAGHPELDVAEVTTLEELAHALAAGLLWVARAGDGEPVGFALVELVGGEPHLEEIDVDPAHGRRGIGRALLAAVLAWARTARHRRVTLTTFRDIEWNAPFYARAGFRELRPEEIGAELAAVVQDEAARGLDPGRRAVMVFDLPRGRVDRELLDEQISYYRARVPEYEEWFFRLGRYDRGEEHRRAWFAEVETLEAALREARPRGRVLELACGTGLWTRRLIPHATELIALDASPEALELNHERLACEKVRYVRADLFQWQPRERFDFVFFGFWLSHVPPARFSAFWETLRAALAPGGRVFFIDNARDPAIAARDHRLPGGDDFVMERVLNDGRRFRVVKVFHEPAELERQLAALGWSGRVQSSGQFFVYGCVAPA